MSVVASSPAVPTFEASELRVRYSGAARPALDGASMRVPGGSFYAVLGPNGSGKSTLLRALMGVLRPEAGSARVEGREARSWARRELARAVGVVSQAESVTFPVTVRELVAMGRYPHLGPLGAEREEDRTAVERALATCDALHLRDRVVQTLSGGEVQRVRIARALAQSPRALALDEPTASLDIRHEMGILELLRQSAQGGMTVLLVTHHLELAGRFADRMLLLARGRVVAEGRPADVLRGEVLSEVYGWRVAVREDPVTGSLRVVALDRPRE